MLIKNRFCWSVGGSKYSNLQTSLGAKFYNKCTNKNSISIEMCSNKTNKNSDAVTDDDWYLTDATIANAVELTKYLMNEYGIDADSIAGLFPFSGQVVTHYNIRKQQGIGPLQPTIDKYAPLTHIRKDCPPIVIISADRELELFGRYEEQAYFWRMLKLVGHPDVTLYEMQGFNHGDMPHPAYHVMKEHIKRLVK